MYSFVRFFSYTGLNIEPNEAAVPENTASGSPRQDNITLVYLWDVFEEDFVKFDSDV